MQKQAEEKGALSVTSIPSGSQVYIEGKYYGETPLDIKLGPAAYEVKAKKTGYGDQREKVLIQSGEKTNLNLILTKQTGNIKLSGDIDGARVY